MSTWIVCAHTAGASATNARRETPRARMIETERLFPDTRVPEREKSIEALPHRQGPTRFLFDTQWNFRQSPDETPRRPRASVLLNLFKMDKRSVEARCQVELCPLAGHVPTGLEPMA